jgi:iron(III) transport system permease protein
LSATLVGFVFAFALTRRDLPLRGFYSLVSLLPLFSPPFVVAFGYLMMFGKNGLVTHGILGLRVSILGWQGLWLSQTMSFFPVATIAIRNVLETIPANLEQAAKNLGASPLRRFLTITLPLASGGIVSAALLVAILVLADFGNPIMIAGDYSVLATEAWLRVQGWADVKGAAALSILLLLPSLALFLLQRLWARGKAFVTIGGKASSLESEPSSPILKVCLVLFCSLATALILLIYGALLLGSLVKGWGFDWSVTSRWILSLGDQAKELGRSLGFSVLAALLSALIGMTTAFLVRERKMPVAKAIDLLSMLPAALPGIFIGIGYSIAFNHPPMDLYGTGLIVVLSLAAWNLSTAYQTGLESLKQISPSLGEAASNLGAKTLQVLVDVHLPLLKGPFMSAFFVGFIRSITTLSVIVFIETASNAVATFTVMNLVNDGFYGKAAALSVALLGLTFLAVGLTRWTFCKKTWSLV